MITMDATAAYRETGSGRKRHEGVRDKIVLNSNITYTMFTYKLMIGTTTLTFGSELNRNPSSIIVSNTIIDEIRPTS